MVSISAADLDGDGYDGSPWATLECSGLYDRQALVAYQYFRAETPLWDEHCKRQPRRQAVMLVEVHKHMDGRQPYPQVSENGFVARVSVATGEWTGRHIGSYRV
jgi:hypothetical protein